MNLFKLELTSATCVKDFRLKQPRDVRFTQMNVPSPDRRLLISPEPDCHRADVSRPTQDVVQLLARVIVRLRQSRKSYRKLEVVLS